MRGFSWPSMGRPEAVSAREVAELIRRVQPPGTPKRRVSRVLVVAVAGGATLGGWAAIVGIPGAMEAVRSLAQPLPPEVTVPAMVGSLVTGCFGVGYCLERLMRARVERGRLAKQLEQTRRNPTLAWYVAGSGALGAERAAAEYLVSHPDVNNIVCLAHPPQSAGREGVVYSLNGNIVVKMPIADAKGNEEAANAGRAEEAPYYHPAHDLALRLAGGPDVRMEVRENHMGPGLSSQTVWGNWAEERTAGKNGGAIGRLNLVIRDYAVPSTEQAASGQDSEGDGVGEGGVLTENPEGSDEVHAMREPIARVETGMVRVDAEHSQGSGFVIDPRGFILTAWHVIEGAQGVRVWMPAHGSREAMVIATDPDSDLALLQVVGLGAISAISLGNSRALRPGDELVAIGYPGATPNIKAPSSTPGILSSHFELEGRRYLQTSCPVTPGISGGALINMEGEAVGIVLQRPETTVDGRRVEGIAFALAIEDAHGILEHRFAASAAKANGHIRRGQ